MNDTIISWNMTNWVTVVLMAAIMFSAIAVAEKVVLSMRQQGA